MSRVLKRGSKFLVIDFFKPAKPFSKLFSQTYGRFVIPTLGKWISKNEEAYHYLHQSIQGFCTRRDYEKMMELTENMVACIADNVMGTTQLVDEQGVAISVTVPWKRLSMKDAVTQVTGIDFYQIENPQEAALKIGVELHKNATCGEILNEVFCDLSFNLDIFINPFVFLGLIYIYKFTC